MSELTSFFVVILTALVFSQAFRKLHVPWIIALILGGMAMGPFGFGIIVPDTTLEFIKNMGLVFLMFMAGMETRFSGMRSVWKESTVIGTITGAVPFLAGLGTALLLGYGMSAAILVGIIFISTSIAVATPYLQEKGLFHTRLGKTIISSIIIQDIASLMILAVVLQYLFRVSPLPFPAFVIIFLVALSGVIIVKWLVPRLRVMLSGIHERGKDIFERDVRIILAILVGAVIVSEALGLHSIIGAFFAGIVVSEATRHPFLKEKIHVLAYGFFVPVFFVILGAQIDIRAFDRVDHLIPMIAVIGASMASKFVSGWFAGRLMGFTTAQSRFMGSNSIPQLSTTLAVVVVGQTLGILEPGLVAILVFLSIVTTFIGPFLSNILFKEVSREYFGDTSIEKEIEKK